MQNFSLPFDTIKYDDLPISTVICEPLLNEYGLLCDYKILYANTELRKYWDIYTPNESCIGSCILATSIINKELLNLMDKHAHFEEPTAFSYYVAEVDIHVHFQPFKDLPSPYVGYFLTNISEYEKKSSKIHFLRSIRQIESAALLVNQHENGRIESIFVSKEFAKLLECTEDEALNYMNGEGFITSTHRDDRYLVEQMLLNRSSENKTKELTIRKITTKGNVIWCNIHYAFIDDFGEHYIYCNYFDVTSLRIYTQRVKSAYNSIVNTFYRENEFTLSMFRVNLTRNTTEDMKGKDLFDTDLIDQPYSEMFQLRAENYPIKQEQLRFREIFNRNKLITSYNNGRTQFSGYCFSRRKDGRFCYVKFQIVLTRHPISNDVIAFISEQEASREKVEVALIDKILARQFDMISYIVNGKYGVIFGESSLIEKGSIFPKSKRGIYKDYLNTQVIPVLSGSEAQKKSMTEALQLDVIEKNAQPEKPYMVNIACLIDGEIYYKQLDFYNIDPQAEFYILLKSDTTEIQRKQIQQNERLKLALNEAKAANIAKSSFLSRMSHEIRTPMNAIIGLDNIALHEPNLSDILKEHLNQIGQSARYLLSLINDILDMSRIESGRMTIKSEEFEFDSFLEQIKSIVDGQCCDKGLQFHCNISGNIQQFYIGDDTKLQQILINILGNAVKFTDTGGSIYLDVECTAQYEGHSNFRFTIKDTGIGMNKNYLPKIFDAFTQEDATTTSKYGGSGLGLAITKNLVEMMNGTIMVDSEKGVGTTFIVNLPLKNSNRQIVEGEVFNPQNLKVLVIDDDPVSCDHARTVLGESGIETETCPSGEKALEIIRLKHARREEYNLILIDFQMPIQNGLEVTKSIREILGDFPTVIMITGFDTFELEEKAIEAGADAVMEKPLTINNLIYEVQQIMRRKKAAKEVVLADLDGRRILIAEDMMVNAQIMIMLLSMKNILTEHAENGKIAVEMFKKSPPGYYDAILMDIRMPEMDGLQAAETIRELEHTNSKTIPIIAMTANAFDEDVQRSLKAGMNAHLTKPVEPENLFRTLQELIGKNLKNN